jgi:hypothetical protein
MAPIMLLPYWLECRYGPHALVGVALVTTPLAFVPLWAIWPPLSINVFAFVLGMSVPTVGRRFAAACSQRAAILWAALAIAVLLSTRPCLGLFSRISVVVEAYSAWVLVSLTAYRVDLSLLRLLDVRPLRLLGLSSGSYYVLHVAAIPPTLLLAAAVSRYRPIAASKKRCCSPLLL